MLKANGPPELALQATAVARPVALRYPFKVGYHFKSRLRHAGFLPMDVGATENCLLAVVLWSESHPPGMFPPIMQRKYKLCLRPHDFLLPDKDDKNYIPHVLLLYKHKS